jgi:hypothetical protein
VVVHGAGGSLSGRGCAQERRSGSARSTAGVDPATRRAGAGNCGDPRRGELDFADGDLMVEITEGGETPFVIGARGRRLTGSRDGRGVRALRGPG